MPTKTETEPKGRWKNGVPITLQSRRSSVTNHMIYIFGYNTAQTRKQLQSQQNETCQYSVCTQVPCVLRYWDPTQKCYITYKDFNLSENNATSISLPDPCTAHPCEVIVAAEWQMVVDVTVDIDYPDDGRSVVSCCRLFGADYAARAI